MPESNSACAFCKIISGNIPATKEYEDDSCLVISDIHPQAPVHLLVVAREHGREFVAAPNDLLEQMMGVAKRVISEKGILSSYRLVINGGSATLVPNHLHIHVLGQVKSDRGV